MTGKALGELGGSAAASVKSKSHRDRGDVVRLALGGALLFGCESVFEQRDRGIVERVDLLERRRAGAVPCLEHGSGDVLTVRGVRRKNLDPTHFAELVEHLPGVDGRQEKSVDVNVLERVQRVLGLQHRDEKGHPHLIAGVLGAAGDVDGVFDWQRVAENDETGLGVGGGASHLLGVVELADCDFTQPEADLADHFRGNAGHQNFDGLRHGLADEGFQSGFSPEPLRARAQR